MRYFVILPNDHFGEPPTVIAEVTHDVIDDDRATTLATALAGPDAVVCTRVELLLQDGGVAALAAWHSAEDSTFALAEHRGSRTEHPATQEDPKHRHLRLVQ